MNKYQIPNSPRYALAMRRLGVTHQIFDQYAPTYELQEKLEVELTKIKTSIERERQTILQNGIHLIEWEALGRPLNLKKYVIQDRKLKKQPQSSQLQDSVNKPKQQQQPIYEDECFQDDDERNLIIKKQSKITKQNYLKYDEKKQQLFQQQQEKAIKLLEQTQKAQQHAQSVIQRNLNLKQQEFLEKQHEKNEKLEKAYSLYQTVQYEKLQKFREQQQIKEEKALRLQLEKAKQQKQKQNIQYQKTVDQQQRLNNYYNSIQKQQQYQLQTQTFKEVSARKQKHNIDHQRQQILNQNSLNLTLTSSKAQINIQNALEQRQNETISRQKFQIENADRQRQQLIQQKQEIAAKEEVRQFQANLNRIQIMRQRDFQLQNTVFRQPSPEPRNFRVPKPSQNNKFIPQDDVSEYVNYLLKTEGESCDKSVKNPKAMAIQARQMAMSPDLKDRLKAVEMTKAAAQQIRAASPIRR